MEVAFRVSGLAPNFVGSLEILALVTIVDVPFGKQVILDPDDFANGFDDGDLARQVERGVREDRFGHCILDVA